MAAMMKTLMAFDPAAKALADLLCKAAGVDLPNVQRIECVWDCRSAMTFTVTLVADRETVEKSVSEWQPS